MVKVTLLGCGGTQPLPERALSSLAITVGGSTVLIDCGEGTQTAARRCGVSIFKIDAVLLTHFHGDHIFGLPGLWQTMAALGRTAPLVMAGPPGLEALLRTLYSVAGPLPFEIRPLEMTDCKGEFEVPAGLITTFPLKHRIECCGYAYTLPRAGKFDPARAIAAGIPQKYWSALQAGQAVDGFTPEQVLGTPRRGLKIVYGCDTAPCHALQAAAHEADLLCMDATYAEDTDADKARLYGHSTCRATGALAVKAGARRLWLTHYSAAVPVSEGGTDAGLAAAQSEYPAAEAGFDGKTIDLCFDTDM